MLWSCRLSGELERRSYSGNMQYGYNNWSPPTQSNETANGYYLERSQSALHVLKQARLLCNEEVCKIVFLWTCSSWFCFRRVKKWSKMIAFYPIQQFQQCIPRMKKMWVCLNLWKFMDYAENINVFYSTFFFTSKINIIYQYYFYS